jgi:hypothetical protein
LSLAYGAVLVLFVYQVLNLNEIAYGDGFSVWNRNFAGKLSNLKILLPLSFIFQPADLALFPCKFK